MAGGKTNTTKIEDLEALTGNIVSRIDVMNVEIKGISDILKKASEAGEGHTSKIIVIEQQLTVLVDMKSCMATVQAIEKELVGIHKDFEILQKWKDELKKGEDEASRRKSAFGPALVAACITGSVALIGTIVNIIITLNR